VRLIYYQGNDSLAPDNLPPGSGYTDFGFDSKIFCKIKELTLKGKCSLTPNEAFRNIKLIDRIRYHREINKKILNESKIVVKIMIDKEFKESHEVLIDTNLWPKFEFIAFQEVIHALFKDFENFGAF